MKKKLNPKQHAELIRLYESGVSVKALARKFKLSASIIYHNYLKSSPRPVKGLGEPLLAKALEVNSEYERALYDWFKSYCDECGFSVRQLIKLLILKEQARAAKGEIK